MSLNVFINFSSAQVSREDSLKVSRGFQKLCAQKSEEHHLALQKRYREDSVKYYHLDLQKLNDYIFTEINEQRKLAGANPLKEKNDSLLQQDCDEFASHLVVNDLIGHDKNAIYSAEIVAANLITMDSNLKRDNPADVYSESAKEIVQTWLNSPNHKFLMLSADYSECIVSISKKYYHSYNVWSSTGKRMNLRNIGFNLRTIVRFYK